MQENAKYLPALGLHFLTPLYDPLVRWFMPECKIKNRLLRQAAIKENQRVLDVGCGTGTLAILIKQVHPGANVVGLDPDPEVLAIALRKAEKLGQRLALDKGFAMRLPYPDESFDHIFSSFVFHHLTTHNKHRTLAEAFRVLRHGGQLYVADFARPNKSLLVMLAEEGFEQIQRFAHYRTLFGPVSLWCALSGKRTPLKKHEATTYS